MVRLFSHTHTHSWNQFKKKRSFLTTTKRTQIVKLMIFLLKGLEQMVGKEVHDGRKEKERQMITQGAGEKYVQEYGRQLKLETTSGKMRRLLVIL